MNESTGAPPQLSPDGLWWWNGQQWQPVPPTRSPTPTPTPTPRRRKRWPFVAGGVAALVVLMSICTVAIGSSSKPAPAAIQTARATVPPAAATPASAPAPPAHDGSCSPQPCANDNYGWILNVSNVRYGAAGGQYETPEAGNVFVFMDVTFTNKLDQERHANPTEFVLLDGAGVKHTWRPLMDACPMWEPVNVTKGGSFGPKCLGFEAAAGKPTGLTLVWTPSVFGGGYNIRLS
jgi:hypothetical protein